MVLRRELDTYISDFYSNHKSALLLTGARQTGKTFAIRRFGMGFKTFVEINFIREPEAIPLFENAKSADDILLRISAFAEKELIKGDTLIFFDEVQECKEIITAIKFLVDDGSYRYALSGSLLGVELNDIKSVPVGYMAIKEVYPLSFREFIANIGVAERIFDHIEEAWRNRTPVDTIVHQRLMSLFNLYLIVGGMPDVVNKYIESKDVKVVEETQKAIVELYRQDIAKYAIKDKLKIKEAFDLIPSELDAKNKRFILKSLNQHAKYDRYANDFLWLKNAGVAIPVYNLETPKIPLKLAETRNLFKLFSNDVGLLTAQYADGIQVKILSGEISVNFGAVFENAIAQELLCLGYIPYYYNSKKYGEVDFVISCDGVVLPIEVKSGKDSERHSALSNLLANKSFNIPEGIVFCQGNLEVKDKVIYAPVYMIMCLKSPSLLSTRYTVDLTGLI